MELVSLAPMPRYDQVIAACGGWGEQVSRYDELPAALARAIEQVTGHRRQALLDIACV